ncbi:hypothetical protein DPEC_G00226630 [Dallia pectoralis]|uniref:Uncharacterized protein n=1 Tax=Dallia pectoralis TaxID=75939 RepID=A0ACC2G0S7_DALPE|nr:hypothetical protein DPEC_G00226630 [Dallia pectoralis]
MSVSLGAALFAPIPYELPARLLTGTEPPVCCCLTLRAPTAQYYTTEDPVVEEACLAPLTTVLVLYGIQGWVTGLYVSQGGPTLRHCTNMSLDPGAVQSLFVTSTLAPLVLRPECSHPACRPLHHVPTHRQEELGSRDVERLCSFRSATNHELERANEQGFSKILPACSERPAAPTLKTTVLDDTS